MTEHHEGSVEPETPSTTPAGPPRRRVRRRRLIGAGIGAAAAAVAARPLLSSSAAAATRPVSMAMHVHSCFSEGGATSRGGGGASMMSQLQQATKHGVDVVWWTDHDWRMQAYGYDTDIRFDGSPEDGALTWEPQDEGPVEGSSEFVTRPRSPDEPGKAMRVTARATGSAQGSHLVWAKAGNSFYSTNLSDTTLHVDVLPEQVGPDAELVVQVETSYRPATAGRPAGVYVLEYRVGGKPGRRLESPLVGVVTQEPSSDWQTLVLEPVEDVRALWPDLVADDSGVARLRFGMRVRGGAEGSAVFDRLRIERSRDLTAWPLETQRRLMEELAPQYPDVTQHLSSEVSMVRHMNVFMEDFELYPYPETETGPTLDRSVGAARRVAAWYQQRGGVVQYNHPDGLNPAELVQTRALGMDLMELGSPRGADETRARIDLFDVAARNGIFLTGTSQLDDHNGRDWTSYKRFWLTSAWAASPTLGDLLAAMRAGALWWWDPTRWPDATMDVRVAGKRAMGQVLLLPRGWANARVEVSSLPDDSRLVVVTGDCDLSGATSPSTSEFAYRPSDLDDGGVELSVKPGTYIRAEVRDAGGEILAFGNPMWVLPADASVEVPATRRFRWS
ncbi:hypothetical protein JQN72_01225 [Phycicoccus sp. CSK15P-2]|uniref:hypothetical protein n=1 Tax=Phycicoccus sp. CSK15P-2 TaxID=2807627 RepID=UPI00194DC868|nr:hypothetical protein [Phycicoccus sp. CSK15P-2]MBM6402867.1 hypothetical protein [Phycicoccus sp. CSK15P-2]